MQKRNLIWLLFGPAFKELRLLFHEWWNRKKIEAAILKDLLDKYERPGNSPGTQTESPGIYLVNMPISGRLIKGRFILCVSTGYFFVRTPPYYWLMTGKRYWSFAKFDFKEYNKAEPPKNR